ncbi:DUF3617 domain-containing protein [Sphingomonas sp.]|uniref:DUF3617 domain-containing protein n=1 Tax=Sphingomonas sp. TaxID=28214 RepID=UPI001D1B0135|nr:DUF3617 domain-containing protein [Sphingomonas sp.]MBX9795922.1 DUF3617 domain-containing protein [Sphingomonas sp.]
MPRYAVPAALLPCLALTAAGPGLINPGKWENRIEVIDVQMPGAPPGIAAAMKGRPQVVTTCVTAEQAAAGPRTLLNADKACRFTRYVAVNGRLDSVLECVRPGATLRATASGTYTPTSYQSVGQSVMTGRTRMTLKTRNTGRRIGAC